MYPAFTIKQVNSYNHIIRLNGTNNNNNNGFKMTPEASQIEMETLEVLKSMLEAVDNIELEIGVVGTVDAS